jgi:type I restriction enzyme R subunit
MVATNREKYELLKEGVLVSYRNAKGELKKTRLKVFDFEEPENNHFLCVRELWIRGDLYRRRADIVGFVNGIPLVFMEVKNVNKNIRLAYIKNLADYKDTVPHLFHHNAMIVLGNGVEAKVGSVSSKFEHFHEWKRLAENELGVVDMETLLKGTCDKRNLMDLFENFIVFDESTGKLAKILAHNHQFLGVNRAIETVKDRENRQGKLGVFWHTQGSGKSYSMVFFTRKVHRKIGGNFTFLVCTDRDDLDTQIYKTFAGCGLVNNDKDPCRAKSESHLTELLNQHKSYVFSLVQKFNRNIDPDEGYSQRDDIIVISDEAHRTQYGLLSLNMRNALPHASYIGFTGTPLFKDDEITRRVFGDYVSTYDFQRAVEDGATVPLYYDARGDKLGVSTKDLNDRIAEKLEEIDHEDIDLRQHLEKELKRDYHIITSQERLDQIARDFVQHYSTAWESGKAMMVCIDKLTCVRMYNLIQKYWEKRIQQLDKSISKTKDEQEEIYLIRQIEWMRETRMAVVVSEEQGEVDKFRKHDLDITVHRKLIKNGFEIAAGSRIDIDEAFKKEEHPFRIAIVCAMWMTGFDVPSLSTLYLDKPLKAHTLMQAIARANRVNEGKTNGLVVDYCGVLRNLRKALAVFAGRADAGHGGTDSDSELDPTRPDEELLEELDNAVSMVNEFLKERNSSLKDVINQTGFRRNAAIAAAKEAANENDETRKRFELMCLAVFNKFRACVNIDGVNNYRQPHDAIAIIYRSLQKDRDETDISDVMRELQGLVDEAVKVKTGQVSPDNKPYDISRIDFDKLRKEFERSSIKRTTVQNLRQAIEVRLQKMLTQNPQRTDFEEHFNRIVGEYNDEKERKTIEQTFEELIRFIQNLDEESNRAIREGLDEESLAIYDLILKPELNASDIKRVKQIAVDLLKTLKEEKLKIDHWRDNEFTRDAVRLAIRDFLWSEDSGLPINSYTENDVTLKADDVFRHIYRVYPTIPSPYYPVAA